MGQPVVEKTFYSLMFTDQNKHKIRTLINPILNINAQFS